MEARGVRNSWLTFDTKFVLSLSAALRSEISVMDNKTNLLLCLMVNNWANKYFSTDWKILNSTLLNTFFALMLSIAESISGERREIAMGCPSGLPPQKFLKDWFDDLITKLPSTITIGCSLCVNKGDFLIMVYSVGFLGLSNFDWSIISLDWVFLSAT